SKGWLEGVTTFNFHMHLPHYALTTDDSKSIHVLAKQPIDMSRPHPFIEAGNREFNMFVWMRPNDDRAGDVLLADSTIFSTLFGRNAGRELMRRVSTVVTSAANPTSPLADTWVSVALTYPGLKALGVPQESLDSFAWEFRQGMAARAQELGDTGESSPSNWERPLG